MIVINFSHPLTPTQITAIENLAGNVIQEVIQIKTQLDPQQPFGEQVKPLIESIPFLSQQWQTEAILINLPSFSPIAALVLAALHGRMGYFPAVVRLRPIEGKVPPQFEVAEILNLQAVRDSARSDR